MGNRAFEVIHVRHFYKKVKVLLHDWFSFSSLSIAIMATSIKLFQFFQKFHETIGISISQANRKQWIITARKITFLICCLQLMFTTFTFLVFETKSMFEFGFGLFITLSTINTNVVYLISLWQLEKTSKYIENCEEFIRKRKSHFEYQFEIG